MNASLAKIALGIACAAFVTAIVALVIAVRASDGPPKSAASAPPSSSPRSSSPPAPSPDPDPVPQARPDPAPADPAPADPAPADPAPACAATCRNGDDCPSIPCRCEDGTTVNTRSCHNSCCVPAPEACDRSCDKHDGPRGTWNDAREGGKQTGKGCNTDHACASKVCLRGYCTRKCTSFGDCPPFWDCDGDGLDRVCRRK